MRLCRRKMRMVLLFAAALTLLLSMSVFAAEKRVSTHIEARVISSENMPTNIPFTVVLGAVNHAPLPAVTEKTVKKSGTVVFDDIVFTEAGDYYYTLTQKTGQEKYVQYDSEGPYAVIVRVTDDPKAPGGLAAAISGWRGTPDQDPGTVTKPDSFTFRNKYNKPSKTVTHTDHGGSGGSHSGKKGSTVKTGDTQDPEFWLLLICGAAAGILVMAGTKRRS